MAEAIDPITHIMMIRPSSEVVAMKLVAATLLVAAMGSHRYRYYTLLRWVVFGVSIFSAFHAGKLGSKPWQWAFAGVALFFNPLLPIHLDRRTWAIIDIGVAAMLLVSIIALGRRLPPT